MIIPANARLCESAVPLIRTLYRSGVSYPEIAEKYGVAQETIRQLLVGLTWSHVPDPLGKVVMRRRGAHPDTARRAKLDRAKAEDIRGHRAAGMSCLQIAAIYGITECTVRDITKGRTWKRSTPAVNPDRSLTTPATPKGSLMSRPTATQPEHLCQRLRALVAADPRSIPQLGADAEIHPEYLRQILRGTKPNPTHDTLLKLLRVLGKRFADLD